jgi:protein-tyrosine sulfotransferase
MPAVTEHAPVVVLAGPDSGGPRLLSLLSASGELACTSGTGVLPLCGQAAEVWQRWCECAVPARAAAETFLGLFPGTRFVCLHREASQVIRAALARSPWGLAGQAYRPFIAAQPGSTVAALATYWIAHTEALLTFQADHPDKCLRVRFEDLTGAMGSTPAALNSFLGLAATGYPGLPSPREDYPPVHHADAPPSAAFPLEQLPPPVLAQVNGLLGQLGYPSLVPG